MIDISTATPEQLYAHMRYLKNREHNNERNRAYYAAHREELTAKAREYRRTHPDKVRAAQKASRTRRKIKEYGQ